MKFISKLFIFIFLIGSVTNAQIHNPVTWDTSVEKINESEFNLLITAGIEEGWHLYSQNNFHKTVFVYYISQPSQHSFQFR